jgi:hypothetical protein
MYFIKNISPNEYNQKSGFENSKYNIRLDTLEKMESVFWVKLELVPERFFSGKNLKTGKAWYK